MNYCFVNGTDRGILLLMLVIIRKKATAREIEQLASGIEGYIKVVVDIGRKIAAGGGFKHVDGEQMLLQDGSKQANLWGGGIDLLTKDIDFDSIINVRPSQNESREVLDPQIRKEVERIIRELLL